MRCAPALARPPCRREKWRNSGGKNENGRKWVAVVQGSSSLGRQESEIRAPSHTKRAAVWQRPQHVRLLPRLQIQVFTSGDLFLQKVPKCCVFCNSKSTLTLNKRFIWAIWWFELINPTWRPHNNHLYLVIYLSSFVPDTSFSRVRLHCIANICYCCLTPF